MEEVFKALGDPTRLSLVRLLAEKGEQCVCNLVEDIGMGQSAISHHLAKLKQAGLLHSRRDGQWIFYSLNIEAIKNGPLAFLAETADTAERAESKIPVRDCC